MKNNASVGSDIAIALSWLRKNGGGGKPGETKVFTKTRNAVIHKQLGKRKKTSPKDVVTLDIKMSSFKSRENIQKKEGGPDKIVTDNQFSSVTLNELEMKARKSYCNFKLQQKSYTMTDINPNEVQMI